MELSHYHIVASFLLRRLILLAFGAPPDRIADCRRLLTVFGSAVIQHDRNTATDKVLLCLAFGWVRHCGSPNYATVAVAAVVAVRALPKLLSVGVAVTLHLTVCVLSPACSV